MANSRPERVVRRQILPLSVFLIAFFLRFAYISIGPFHLDCLYLAIQSTKTLQTLKLQYMFGSGYPLTVLLGSFFVWIFKSIGINDAVLAVNFMSVFFGALGAWMFYWVVENIWGKVTAFIAAVLFIVSPILWSTSVYGMSHAPSLFFLLASLYFILRYLSESKRWLFYAGGVSLGLMGAARLQDMVLMLVPIIYLMMSGFRGKAKLVDSVRQIVVFVAIALGLSGLFHVSYILESRSQDFHQQWSIYWYLGLISNFKGISSVYLISTINFLKVNFGLVGLVIAIIGWLMMFWCQNRRLGAFLALWFGVFFIMWGNLSTIVPRFLVVMIPAMIMMQMFAIQFLLSGGKLMRWFGMSLVLAMIIYQYQVILPVLMYRHQTSAIKEYALWVGQSTPQQALIITGDEGLFINYYAQRKVLSRPNCTVGCSVNELEQFEKQVNDWIDSVGIVYLTNTGLLADNPKGEFKDFIESRYHLKYVGEHLMEDWHQDGFRFRVGYEKLFRVIKRE